MGCIWRHIKTHERERERHHLIHHQRISRTAVLFYLVRFDWILRHFLWRRVAVVVEDLIHIGFLPNFHNRNKLKINLLFSLMNILD